MYGYIAVVLVLLFSFTQTQGVGLRIVSPCKCGQKQTSVSPRIAGGDPVLRNEYPMMVAIFYVPQFVRFVNCGGTIISENYVLTAAHCVQNIEVASLELSVGEHNITEKNSPARQILKVASYTVHPEYNRINNNNDIAIIRVRGTITFNVNVGPVCLPYKYVGWDLTGMTATTMGWGLTSFGGPSSEVLRKVDLAIISPARCQMTEPTLTSQQLCTQTPGKDSCQYDSGGPLLVQDYDTQSLFIVGIVSYGKDCGAGENPGVYTRVTEFLSWIEQNAPENYCKK